MSKRGDDILGAAIGLPLLIGGGILVLALARASLKPSIEEMARFRVVGDLETSTVPEGLDRHFVVVNRSNSLDVVSDPVVSKWIKEHPKVAVLVVSEGNLPPGVFSAFRQTSGALAVEPESRVDLPPTASALVPIFSSL